MRDEQPAMWALAQDYTGPDGQRRTRHGFFCRVRIEDYGPGRIRPHERTHPGPKEDRLRLTRATQANLSPIFSLYDDPDERGLDGARAGTEAAALRRGDRRRRHRAPAVARRRSRGDRGRAGGDARRRAADRRRPPPLRDDARLRRRGRGGDADDAPLRADVPRRAGGPGPDRLPDAPARQRARRRAARRRCASAASATSRSSEIAARSSSRLRPATARSSSATSTHGTSAPTASR